MSDFMRLFRGFLSVLPANDRPLWQRYFDTLCIEDPTRHNMRLRDELSREFRTLDKQKPQPDARKPKAA